MNFILEIILHLLVEIMLVTEWYSLDDTANFISTFENLYVDSTLSTFVMS